MAITTMLRNVRKYLPIGEALYLCVLLIPGIVNDLHIVTVPTKAQFDYYVLQS